MPANWSFSPPWNYSETGLRSWIIWLPYARPNGWSAKRPFAGPEQVLDYVGRYTHRVAISNNRLSDIRVRLPAFGVPVFL
jgi:hypothetical protein